jgi:lipopolysaccharide biosynthesis glycosyltransferase
MQFAKGDFMKFTKKIVAFLFLIVAAVSGFSVICISEVVPVTHELTQQLAPAFEKKNFPIVFASDDNYAMYLGVTLQSLIDNSNSTNNYDIWVLDSGISDGNKETIQSFIGERKNISIRFFDVSKLVEEYKDKFHVEGYWSIAAYYRIFIPQIFHTYDKMLYLDCDLIINEDVSELFKINLGSNLIGASKCYHICPAENHPCCWRDYCKDVLRMKNHDDYFNSGVLLFNVKKMRECAFTTKCLSLKVDHKKLQFAEEGLLNIACEDKVCFIDEKWNVPWHWNLPQHKFRIVHEPWFFKYQGRSLHPYIIHYTTEQKPWNCEVCEPAADIWWYHAKKSPFYKQLIKKNRDNAKIANAKKSAQK